MAITIATDNVVGQHDSDVAQIEIRPGEKMDESGRKLKSGHIKSN